MDLHPWPPEDVYIQLPIESIFVGEKRKKRFDPKDEKNEKFKNNIDRAGMINPIAARPVGEKYELVCGRRRLWAAKQLRWKFVPAIINDWADDELLFLSAAENALRGHLTPAQQIQVMQQLMIEYEKIWGKDPGRRIGGRARAATAYRDPVTKKFVANPVVLSERGPIDGDNFTQEPAKPNLGLAGSDTNGEPAEQSITNRVHADFGESVTRSKREAKIAKALTQDQLVALDTCEKVTKKVLEKLANIKDPDKRKVAFNIMCTGADPASAIEQATSDIPETQEILERLREAQMPDEEWIESFCQKKREEFQDPKHFDRSAILYRRTRDDRAALRAKCGKEVWEAHQERPTGFTWVFVRLLFVDHPRGWEICMKCLGLNVKSPHCSECYGTGFKVKWEWPVKPRR